MVLAVDLADQADTELFGFFDSSDSESSVDSLLSSPPRRSPSPSDDDSWEPSTAKSADSTIDPLDIAECQEDKEEDKA